MNDAERIATAEAEYEDVRDALDLAEITKVADQRERHLAGDRTAYYGHDLLAAVNRGHHRKAKEALREAHARTCKSGFHSTRAGWAGVVSAALDCMAEDGLTAEDIRSILQRDLDATDHFRIEKRVDRASS